MDLRTAIQRRSAEVLKPLVVKPGTFYRVHPKGRPFSKADAQSKVFGYDKLPAGRVKEIVKPATGYSCFANPAHLRQYAEDMGWLDGEDEYGNPTLSDPVVRFEGEVTGQGFDGEPVVVPTSGVLERIKWADFRDRIEVTPNAPEFPRWGET